MIGRGNNDFNKLWLYLLQQSRPKKKKKTNQKLEFELESKKNIKYRFGKHFILNINKLTFVYRDKIQILQI